MVETDRREFMENLLFGIAAAGAAALPTGVLAAPFPIDSVNSSILENPVEETAVTCWWHRGRRVCRRRPVRRVCWWRGRQRICRWR